VQTVKTCKLAHESIALAEMMIVANVTQSTYHRYCLRINNDIIPVQQAGRKKVEIDIARYIDEFLLRKKRSGYRRRFRRSDSFQSFPEHVRRQIIQRATAQFNAESRLELHNVQYWEPHLVWAMDISEYEFEGSVFDALQVIDLGSGIKFEPELKLGTFNAKDVADHLLKLMEKYGAPLFLKRDNGKNLKGNPVDAILTLFAVLPLDSPPYCPQYNGAVERAQGEIKARARKLLSGNQVTDAIKGTLLYAIAESNNQPKARLGNRTPLEIWQKPYRKFNKWERENIFKEVTSHALRMLNGTGFPIHSTIFPAAWRKAVRCQMEQMGILKLFKNGKQVVCHVAAR
jgi:hypothetical protein